MARRDVTHLTLHYDRLEGRERDDDDTYERTRQWFIDGLSMVPRMKPSAKSGGGGGGRRVRVPNIAIPMTKET